MRQERLSAPRSTVPCMHSAAQRAARKAGIVVSGAAVGAPWASQLQHARSGRASLPCPTPFDPFRSPVPACTDRSRANGFRTVAGRSKRPEREEEGVQAPQRRQLLLTADFSWKEVTKCWPVHPPLTRNFAASVPSYLASSKVARRPRLEEVALVSRGRSGGTQGGWPGQGSGVGPGRMDDILRQGASANAPSAPSFALSAKKGP